LEAYQARVAKAQAAVNQPDVLNGNHTMLKKAAMFTGFTASLATVCFGNLMTGC
jgi:hypothetical protein